MPKVGAFAMTVSI